MVSRAVYLPVSSRVFEHFFSASLGSAIQRRATSKELRLGSPYPLERLASLFRHTHDGFLRRSYTPECLNFSDNPVCSSIRLHRGSIPGKKDSSCHTHFARLVGDRLTSTQRATNHYLDL